MFHRLKNLFLPVLLLMPFAAAAAELPVIPLSPRITAVTVYPDRAMTKRSGTVDLKPGSYLLQVSPLPVLMQDDSIRVEGRGTALTTITGMEVKRSFTPQTPEKRIRELEEEIKALQRSAAGLDARKDGLVAQKSFINSIKVAWGERISKELASGKPTATELNEALAFIGTGITTTEEKALDVETEKVKIKEKIDALTAQLEASRGSGQKEQKSVQVAVEVTKAGTFTVELTGVVSHAGWEPAYDVRLAGDSQSVEMTVKGLVRQQTGEDWTNADLSLSTARPAIGGFPPTLYPWHISFYRPTPIMYGAAPMAAPAPMAKAARSRIMKEEVADGAAEPEVEAQQLTAQVSDEQSSVLFHIQRPVDIPADGTGHATTIAVEKLPVKVDYLSVPKLSPYAYLRSEIVNRAAYPLLPGKVNIFTGGNFIGSGYLKKVAAGEKFELFFGVDDQVTVKREELKRHKEAGLFGKNRQTYSYRIEVHNYRKEPKTVIVNDQLPLAGDEEIKVSLEEPSMKPDEVKTDGTIVWKLPVEPGEKREITFTIQVEYPKDKEVSGL